MFTDCEKTNKNPSLYPVLSLALVGDAVYELFIRTKLLHHSGSIAHTLHKRAIAFVKAGGQAASMQALLDVLSEKEMSVYKRGRNAKSPTVPKNADLTQYRIATGFETLLGYLYLNNENERLDELMNIAYKAIADKI